MKSSRFFLVAFIFLFVCIIVILAIAYLTFIDFQRSNKISYGVHSLKVDLGGMTELQATQALRKAARKRTNQNAVLLSYEKKSWQIAPIEIELRPKPEDTAFKATTLCRSGDIYRDLIDSWYTYQNGHELIISATCNKEKLKALLDKIAKEVDAPYKSASIYLTENNVIIREKGAIGKRTDTADLTDHLFPSIIELRLPRRIEIVPDLEYPEVMDQDLEKIDTILLSLEVSEDIAPFLNQRLVKGKKETYINELSLTLKNPLSDNIYLVTKQNILYVLGNSSNKEKLDAAMLGL